MIDTKHFAVHIEFNAEVARAMSDQAKQADPRAVTALVAHCHRAIVAAAEKGQESVADPHSGLRSSPKPAEIDLAYARLEAQGFAVRRGVDPLGKATYEVSW